MTQLVTLASVTSVVAYESMCKWIAESENLAECKDIADKSAALKEYARRMQNQEVERRAINVRLIAERRYGELLKHLAKATPKQVASAGGNAKAGKVLPAVVAGSTPYREAIQRDGVSERQAQRLQALADVPKPVFEQALRDPVAKPSARRLVDAARDPRPEMPDDSLWIWGRMRDFEREGYARKSAERLLEPMTESMRADVLRIAPLMAEFFTQLDEVSHEHA